MRKGGLDARVNHVAPKSGGDPEISRVSPEMAPWGTKKQGPPAVPLVTFSFAAGVKGQISSLKSECDTFEHLHTPDQYSPACPWLAVFSASCFNIPGFSM